MRAFLVTLLIGVMFDQSCVCALSEKFWGRECPSGIQLLNMTKYIDVILREHNVRRNKLGWSKIKSVPTAARMLTLEWSWELANKAGENVKQCKVQSDDCHYTLRFPLAGQNVGMDSGFTSTASRFKDIIEKWWGGYKFVTKKIIGNYPDIDNAPFSNFTVMANDKSTHIGCAAIILKKTFFKQNVLLTCNYAVGNIPGRPVYKIGVGAAECKTGRNPNFLHLCSLDENKMI